VARRLRILPRAQSRWQEHPLALTTVVAGMVVIAAVVFVFTVGLVTASVMQLTNVKRK